MQGNIYKFQGLGPAAFALFVLLEGGGVILKCTTGTKGKKVQTDQEKKLINNFLKFQITPRSRNHIKLLA